MGVIIMSEGALSSVIDTCAQSIDARRILCVHKACATKLFNLSIHITYHRQNFILIQRVVGFYFSD